MIVILVVADCARTGHPAPGSIASVATVTATNTRNHLTVFIASSLLLCLPRVHIPRRVTHYIGVTTAMLRSGLRMERAGGPYRQQFGCHRLICYAPGFWA